MLFIYFDLFVNKIVRFMKKLLVILFIIFSLKAAAQADFPKQQATAKLFFHDLETKQYAAARNNMAGLLKTLFTAKRIEAMFGAQMDMLGTIQLDTVKKRSDKSVQVEYRHAFDPTEQQKMSLVFNKKGKIIGIAARPLKPIWPDSILNKTTTFSYETFSTSLDSLLALKTDLAHFNGGVLVMHKGKPIYKKYIGTTFNALNANLSDESKIELASCSKQFTAIAVMQLIQNGKVKLNDPIVMYFPELPYKTITIAQLLNHTSGIPDYMELIGNKGDTLHMYTNAEMIALMAKHKPKAAFKAGKTFEYSNTGYALLAELVARTSKMKFEDYMQKHLFLPAGMKHTAVITGRRAAKAIDPHLVFGKVRNPILTNQYIFPDSLPEYNYLYAFDGIYGDGCVNTNLNDLLLWENALKKGLIVHDSLLQKCYTPSPLTLPDKELNTYGYGWELVNEKGKLPVASHSGSWPGFISYNIKLLNQDLNVWILTNTEYYNSPNLGIRIAKYFLTGNF